jgi:phytoene dehydrogenase-like protein
MTRFGIRAVRSAAGLAAGVFDRPPARALLAGCAGHSIMPLERPFSASFGVLFAASAHAVGWPIPKGGSQKIADALASYVRSLGGHIETSRPVSSIEELKGAGVVLFDTTPRQLVAIAGSRLAAGYRRRVLRFRYGPGTFKVDFALDGPVPWKAEECLSAGTVHVGGTLEDIAASERAVDAGVEPENPFVLLAQQSLFDASRAPAGRHTVWAYCHVPAGSTVDMTERIESQIERFAPGFRDRVVARRSRSPADMEAYNANYIGGDIAGGAHSGLQMVARPVLKWNPYRTSDPDLLLCSSSTPPGAGVHGMCGYFAAKAAARRLERGRERPGHS